MAKGRHASETENPFYRDLVVMIVGIVLVGAAVFLLLYLLSGGPEPDAEGSTTTTSSAVTTTTTRATTTTTESTSTSAPGTTGTSVTVRDPSDVRVVVLNSIGLSGAAGRKTQELADAGYQTQEAGDYQPEQDPSRIWYRQGFDSEADALLEFLPGAAVEPIPDEDLQTGADVVLVLGTGYSE
jgi:LytR cell envelope-related transcriptional attenuator